MPRRTLKPFAVEVRRGGRTVKQAAASAPSMADLIRDAEQPRVTSWPGIDQEPAGSPKAAEPPQAAAVVMPTGRVLPVLADFVPTVAVVEPEPSALHAIEGMWPEDDGVEEMLEAEAEQIASSPTVDTKLIAGTVLFRRGRSHLPRHEFRREEKWKARLPAVVRLVRKRGV